MQKLLTTPAGIQVQLIFWKVMVVLAEFALEHRKTARIIIRYGPVLVYGTIAYILGMAAGELLQTYLY